MLDRLVKHGDWLQCRPASGGQVLLWYLSKVRPPHSILPHDISGLPPPPPPSLSFIRCFWLPSPALTTCPNHDRLGIVIFSLSHRAAETLASLQVYCHWLSLLHLYSHVHKQYENEFVSIVSSCIDAIIPLLHEEVGWTLFCLMSVNRQLREWENNVHFIYNSFPGSRTRFTSRVSFSGVLDNQRSTVILRCLGNGTETLSRSDRRETEADSSRGKVTLYTVVYIEGWTVTNKNISIITWNVHGHDVVLIWSANYLSFCCR
jgi:hypothetical protein